jgi:hypothetical protein
VHAELADGVLTVTAPREAAFKPHLVGIAG